MLEESGVNLTPQMGHRIETFCSTNINKELIKIYLNTINNSVDRVV
jgi:hypothetical protein